MTQELTKTTEAVFKTPDEAFRALDAAAQEAGGEWTLPPGEEGAVGRTMFDLPTSHDGTITVLLPGDGVSALPSQALVRISSRGDGRIYLGAVAAGPFAEPDGLRADSTPMVVSTVRGGLLMPRYHGRVQIELLGEQLREGVIVPPRRRPTPNSPVFVLGAVETAKVLKITGNLRLGMADGFEDLVVSVPSDSKQVFPRHLGVLGTTGGGKSTTVSGLVYKAQKADMAVILLDTEGEYCAIHKPTDDQGMIRALQDLGMKPEGVKNTSVYHLVGRDPYNPDHPRIVPFSLRFSDLSVYAVAEILELNDAQEERFLKAYDITKAVLERLGIWPSNASEREELLQLDELSRGYPRMTLSHMYDMVRLSAATVGKDTDPSLENPTFQEKVNELKQIVNAANLPGNVFSWRKVQGRLNNLKRIKVFDSDAAAPLNYGAMLRPGHVSIIDLSDTDSTHVNNLVIAELLRGVQDQQEANYKAAVKAGKQPTPTLVLIEEAHEFLSAHRIAKMQVLFEQVARIARRGRKRWLGLGFITQLPQHLPDEVLGLINNWVLHKIGDASVIARLKRSIGGISEGFWETMPSLAPGQAVVSFTTMTRPLRVGVDPTPCKLLMDK